MTARTLIPLAFLLMVPCAALAELKDYQVGRLIMLKSDCQVTSLKRTEEKDGSWTYRGVCGNKTFYPDGIRVNCPDPQSNDERSCVIETKAKSFDHLKLLQRPE